jgi:hypothetical protein
MGTIRDRIHHPVTCVRCLQVREYSDVDRLMWCESCREAARRRASQWGWGAGVVLAGGLAIWIWTVIQPSDLVVGGWIATVVAALWIGGKVAREIAYGVMRFKNARAVEAVPPGSGEGDLDDSP